MAYLLQILVVVISLRIKLGANKQITQLALYTMIGPKQKKGFATMYCKRADGDPNEFSWRHDYYLGVVEVKEIITVSLKKKGMSWPALPSKIKSRGNNLVRLRYTDR